MLINTDCTVLTRSTNPETRLYEWEKEVYRDVYFETKTATNETGQSHKGKKYCYCCIYGITQINAKIDDIIVKGEISENITDITEIKSKYPAFSITSITPCDMGNTKHIEIEGG